MSDCIFCKIIKGEIPCKKVYEDDDVLAFHDINPSAPIHFLLIPKKHLESLAHIQPEDTALLGKTRRAPRGLIFRKPTYVGFSSILRTYRAAPAARNVSLRTDPIKRSD